jgi:hypothetical protein
MARLVTTRSIFLATCLTAGVFSAAGAAEVADIEAALAHGTLGIAGPMKKGVVPLCVPIGIALNASDELYVGDHYAASGCGPTSQITVYDSNGKPEPTKTITKPLMPRVTSTLRIMRMFRSKSSTSKASRRRRKP